VSVSNKFDQLAGENENDYDQENVERKVKVIDKEKEKVRKSVRKVGKKQRRKEKKMKDNAKNTINVLREARSNELNSAGPSEWTEIEATVDSGACDTVMPADECRHINIVSSEKSRSGFQYEIADGTEIPNKGERQCEVMTEGSGQVKRIHIQVADVHKCLLSITKVADMGFRCILEKQGGYLEDTYTGERTPIWRKGNLYVMKMWVRQAKIPDTTTGFHRQG